MQLYQTISARRGTGVRIPRDLCFYTPTEVLSGLRTNTKVKKWLDYISDSYVPERAKVLLIYPCSADKPYHKSRSYRALFRTLERLGPLRASVQVATISEPFGLVPESFYEKNIPSHDWRTEWYDCPGLFRWFCVRHGLDYSEVDLEESIRILGETVGRFLARAKDNNSYDSIIAAVRTYSSALEVKRDHTHRRIIELASEQSGVKVRLFPSKRLVSRLVEQRGRFAWDIRGVSHQFMQDKLLIQIRRALNA